MDPQVVESKVLRRFYSDIQDVMVHPGSVAAQLFQEGVVSEPVVNEVEVSGRTQEEKNGAIMRSVRAAVRGDPKNLLVFVSVLEKFLESAPVARRMRDALRSEWLDAQQQCEARSPPTSPTKGDVIVPEVYKREFDMFQNEFINLVLKISEILKEKSVSLEKLKWLLTSHPILESPLQDADTIDKVMREVQRHSSLINCSYLEAIAGHFNIPEATREINSYYKLVEEFCQHTLKQHSYMTPFLAEDAQSSLLSSNSITFKLEWNPDEKTLADIQGLLRTTFHSLASHIHIVVIGGGSVTVICYAPQYLMGALVKLAKESRKMLMENNVTYLSVGYAVLLDNSDQEKVPVLEDQVFTLKQENTALQLKLSALQEKNQMLQSQLSQLMETEQEIFQLKPPPGAGGRGVSASQEKKTMMQAMEVQEKLTPHHEELISPTKSLEMPILQSELSQLMETEQETLQLKPYPGSERLPLSHGKLIRHTKSYEMPTRSRVELTNATPALYRYMMEQQQVEDINMRWSASADVVEEILQGLRCNTSLTSLDLGSSSLTAENITTLSASLTINNTLHHLDLSCDLDDHAVEQLSAGLHKNTSVHTLHLSTNDTGARHLATMLTVNTTLRTLNLQHSSISDDGVHHLSKGLQHNSSVTHLNLSFSDSITSAGAVALSDMMKVNRSLKLLSLHRTSIGEEGAAALMEALIQHGAVVHLSLPTSLEEYCKNHSSYDKVKDRVKCY